MNVCIEWRVVGKLFFTPCNVALEHERRSTINGHFESAKYMRRSEQFPRQRQITMTEVVAGRTVASAERIKVSGVLLQLLLRYSWL
jgi:hypothetical protein